MSMSKLMLRPRITKRDVAKAYGSARRKHPDGGEPDPAMVMRQLGDWATDELVRELERHEALIDELCGKETQ